MSLKFTRNIPKDDRVKLRCVAYKNYLTYDGASIRLKIVWPMSFAYSLLTMGSSVYVSYAYYVTLLDWNVFCIYDK